MRLQPLPARTNSVKNMLIGFLRHTGFNGLISGSEASAGGGRSSASCQHRYWAGMSTEVRVAGQCTHQYDTIESRVVFSLDNVFLVELGGIRVATKRPHRKDRVGSSPSRLRHHDEVQEASSRQGHVYKESSVDRRRAGSQSSCRI